MICAGIILAVVAIASVVVAATVLSTSHPIQGIHYILAAAAGAGALVFLFAAAGTAQDHWDQTCHRHGGVAVKSDVCVKPHSTIHIS